uniref:Uncharacterized protein n=1 Tax=Oryza glumipatula TaxID=40148 RepID=A0A0E0AQA8_9ORYZ
MYQNIILSLYSDRTAYNLVLHEHGPKLYDKLTEDMEDHLQEMRVSIEAAQGGLKIIDRLRSKQLACIPQHSMVGGSKRWKEKTY